MGFESFNQPTRAETSKDLSDEKTVQEFSWGNSPDSNDGLGIESKNDSEVSFDDPETVENYNIKKEAILGHIAELDAELQSVTEEPGEHIDEVYMNELFEQRDFLQQEKVRVSANYPGDWTTLLHNRMLDPLTKDKFVAQRTESMVVMKSGSPSPLDRPYEHQQHYQEQIDDYDNRVNGIFSVTQTGQATDFKRKPHHLGEGNIDQPGTVFLDAADKAGIPLSVRQKNIIEAHEKGHGLRDFQSPLDKTEVRAIIDDEALDELLQSYREAEASGERSGRFRSTYLEKPEEIIERMAQFKNYFGMTADEQFTQKHLEHIRKHYVADTGLDNGVSDFLICITLKTAPAFLQVINKYPI